MKRAIKASIAALAFVPAFGFGMSAPAVADGEVQINLNPNHCQAVTSGGVGSSGRCVFAASPDLNGSHLRVRAFRGDGTATVACNNVVLASASDTDATSAFGSSDGWTNPGGSCVLTVTITATAASGPGHVDAWTYP